MSLRLRLVVLGLFCLAALGWTIAAVRTAPEQNRHASGQPQNRVAGARFPDPPAASEYFYWYGDRRIALEPQPGRLAVLFDADVPEAQRRAIVRSDAALEDLENVLLPGGYRLAKARPQANRENPAAIACRMACLPGVRHASPIFRAQERHDLVPSDRLLVRMKADVTEAGLRAFLANEGLETIRRSEPEAPGRGVFLHVRIAAPRGPNAPLALADRLHADPRIEYADPDFICLNFQLAMNLPNDPLYGKPNIEPHWNLNRMRVPSAWAIGRCIDANPNAPVIAFIDSGIDRDHPDLHDLVLAGCNFTSAGSRSDTSDTFGHGTAVAGMACAIANNGTGMAGVSWGAAIMPLKVSQTSPWTISAVTHEYTTGTQTSWLVDALHYARDRGADAINNSWLFAPLPSIADAIRSAHTAGRANRGCVLTAPVGNWQGVEPSGVVFPAALPDCIAVGMTDYADCLVRKWVWNPKTPAYEVKEGSHVGPQVDVVAPSAMGYTMTGQQYKMISTDIRGDGGFSASGKPTDCNTYGPDYNAFAGGTSCAAAEVSGIAALLLSHNRDLTAMQVQALIEFSADDRPSIDTTDTVGRDPSYGYGRVNAERALLLADRTGLVCRDERAIHQASIDSGGNVVTEADLTSSAAIGALSAQASDLLILRDDAGAVMTRITAHGTLVTKGPLREGLTDATMPPAEATDLWVQRENGGTAVSARISSDGTLYTKGRVLIGARPDRASSMGK